MSTPIHIFSNLKTILWIALSSIVYLLVYSKLPATKFAMKTLSRIVTVSFENVGCLSERSGPIWAEEKEIYETMASLNLIFRKPVMNVSVLQRCPSYRESNKGSRERQGPTLVVRFTEVSVL